ncbi:phosphate ABC transporter substrate-binding protein [Spiroplasma endosymbiont of Amphibalanus improvisus]|uniref:phosphate ABC transporter substrate-binding protein n=1 Tax=Spiroplasma endosymbiont of Amphibalanus improvisus TaxID=3066327 RepID=UPI00313F29BD
MSRKKEQKKDFSKFWENFKKSFLLFIENFKEKKIKYIASFFLFVLLFSLTVWTFASSHSTIIAGGSTSVDIVLQDLTNQYRNEEKGGDDILYNSLGSSAALVGVKNNSYSFGFLSDELQDDEADELFSDYNVLRFAFAIDYLLIIYNLPEDSINQSSLEQSDFLGDHLIVGSWDDTNANEDGPKNIQELYSGDYTWKNVFGDQLVSNETTTKPPITYTRESGSGTRSFFESSVIEENSYNYNSVVASNGAMLDSVESTPGSVGYVSFSYLNKIIYDYQNGNHDIHIAFLGFPNKNPSAIISPYKTIDDKGEAIDPQNPFNDNYSLTRPFTGIVNTSSKDFDKAMKFITWMLAPAFSQNLPTQPTVDEASYWYLKNGLKPISQSDDYFKKYLDYDYGAGNKNIWDYMQIYKDEIPGEII